MWLNLTCIKNEKAFIDIFLLCVAIICSGQNHLSFRNIPIDGKLNDFVSKMKSIGYSSTYSTDKAEILEGSFAGKEAKIYVLAFPKTKIVYKVSVRYPEVKTWLKAKSDYLDIKYLFEKKYGKPGEVFEFF